MSFFVWSTTASTNQNVDSTINLAEGQAPSTLNDAQRAQMAVLAAFRQDACGLAVTTGGPTAFAYTTSQSANLGQATPATPYTGMELLLTFNQAPNSNATLAVDGGTAFPINVSGAAVTSGMITTNTPYHFIFSGTVWNAADFYPATFGGSVSTGQLPANQIIRQFAALQQGGGSVVSTGVIGYFYVPMQVTPTGWWIYGDGSSGSAVVAWETSGGSAMDGSQRPTCTSATNASSAAVGTWTSPITVGFYRFRIVSVSTFTILSVGFTANAT